MNNASRKDVLVQYLYNTVFWVHPNHGLINYKHTKTKCRLYWCLIEFVDWKYSQSCWYFRPSFVTIAPLTFSLVHIPPPTLSKVKVQYIQTVCGWEGAGWCWVVLETIFCRSLPLCIWPGSEVEPTKLPYHPKQKPRSGGGLQQINTCRKVPLQVNFCR